MSVRRHLDADDADRASRAAADRTDRYRRRMSSPADPDAPRPVVIQLRTPDGTREEREVLGWPTSVPGIVTWWTGDGWSVTHEPSGFAVVGYWSCCREHATALVAKHLAGLDWAIRDPQDAAGEHEAAARALNADPDVWDCDDALITWGEAVAVFVHATRVSPTVARRLMQDLGRAGLLGDAVGVPPPGPTVAEMGGTFSGPDSVEWLRQQREREVPS